MGVRWINVLLAVAIGGAFGGFLLGVRPTAKSERVTTPAPVMQPAEAAVTYRELRDARRGPNAGFRVAIADLPPTVVTSDPAQQTEADRRGALVDRARHRAFAGAPPTIPHAVTEQTVASCLACHGTPVTIGGKTAPQISHRAYGSCTQCHVPQHDATTADAGWAPNDFVGMAPVIRGERAWAGAPPTIPHTTWMRSKCGSCHGPHGRFGMQSTHPERRSCTQCHAPSARLDQR